MEKGVCSQCQMIQDLDSWNRYIDSHDAFGRYCSGSGTVPQAYVGSGTKNKWEEEEIDDND